MWLVGWLGPPYFLLSPAWQLWRHRLGVIVNLWLACASIFLLVFTYCTDHNALLDYQVCRQFCWHDWKEIFDIPQLLIGLPPVCRFLFCLFCIQINGSIKIHATPQVGLCFIISHIIGGTKRLVQPTKIDAVQKLLRYLSEEFNLNNYVKYFPVMAINEVGNALPYYILHGDWSTPEGIDEIFLEKK